jgi:hypothetical protein
LASSTATKSVPVDLKLGGEGREERDGVLELVVRKPPAFDLSGDVAVRSRLPGHGAQIAVRPALVEESRDFDQ